MLMLAGMLALTLAAEDAPAEPLRLLCKGYIDTPIEHSALHFLAKGGLSTTSYYGSRRDSEHLLVEVSGETARIRLPKAMVTQVNSGGDDGWWKVSDLKVTAWTISGWFRINIVNKPSFTIDRVTGDMDLGGAYPFKGACEKTTSTEGKF